jgi:hypothetical protein
MFLDTSTFPSLTFLSMNLKIVMDSNSASMAFPAIGHNNNVVTIIQNARALKKL